MLWHFFWATWFIKKIIWTIMNRNKSWVVDFWFTWLVSGAIISQSKVDDKRSHRNQKKSEDRRVETAVFSSVPGESADWRQGFSGSWSWMKSWRPWTACCLQVLAPSHTIPSMQTQIGRSVKHADHKHTPYVHLQGPSLRGTPKRG